MYSTTENPSIEEDSYQDISGVVASRQDLLNKKKERDLNEETLTLFEKYVQKGQVL